MTDLILNQQLQAIIHSPHVNVYIRFHLDIHNQDFRPFIHTIISPDFQFDFNSFKPIAILDSDFA